MPRAPERARGLTAKQRKFVNAYLGAANGNATRAAEIAGFSDPHANGYHLLRYPLIRARIEQVIAKDAMSAGEVLARLTAIARLDADDYLSTDPVSGQARVDLDKARDRGVLQYVDSVSITDTGTRLKLPSKLEALNVLAKHHGLLVERVAVDLKSDDAAIKAEILEKLRAALPSLAPSERDILVNQKSLPSPDLCNDSEQSSDSEQKRQDTAS